MKRDYQCSWRNRGWLRELCLLNQIKLSLTGYDSFQCFPYDVFKKLMCLVFKILCHNAPVHKPAYKYQMTLPFHLSTRAANTLPLTPCQKASKRPLGESTWEKSKQLCKVKSRVGIRSNTHWPYRKTTLQLIKPYQSKSTSLISFWAWDGNGLIWLTTSKGNKALKKKNNVYSYLSRTWGEKSNPSWVGAKLFRAIPRRFHCHMSSLTHINLWNSRTGRYLGEK